MTVRREIVESPSELHGAKNNEVRGATKKERRGGESAIGAEAFMNNAG
jgi:hypothetical protein